MEHLKRKWKKLPKAVRKPLVMMLGTVIILGGIVLLPLPGPGWVIIFFGFAVLATEFAFAERLRDWTIDNLKRLVKRAQNAWRKARRRQR